MKKIDLSYSLINAFWEYSKGEECGVLFQAVYLDKTHKKPITKAMQLGLRAEYEMIGSLTREGKVPEQVLTKTGKPKPTANTNYLIEQVNNFNNIIKFHKIKWTDASINQVWKIEKDKYNIVGHPDLPAIMNGKTVIIDIKTTGKIDDKRSDYGWHKEKVIWRKDLKLQVENYQLLDFQRNGNKSDFYYFVFANNNPTKCKIYCIKFDINKIKILEEELEKIYQVISFQYEMGSFEAIPEMERCSECPLRNECEDFTNIPKVQKISIE